MVRVRVGVRVQFGLGQLINPVTLTLGTVGMANPNPPISVLTLLVTAGRVELGLQLDRRALRRRHPRRLISALPYSIIGELWD